MTDAPALPAPADRRPPRVNPAPQARPEAVVLLEELLRTLYPERPPLDCVTLDDVLERYWLTGLGGPALAAIEQSQRIIRARGEFDLIGLNEFHIGLIYLHWEDHRAAANQFFLARQPWSLANDPPALCLAHFAQGLALYHAAHFEPAMLQLSRAERLLDRPPAGMHATRQAELAAKMRPVLEVTQKTLRRQMWPRDQAPDEAKSLYLSVPSLGSPAWDENVIYGAPPAAPAGAPPPPDGARLFSTTSQVPRPISNLPGAGAHVAPAPVPGHVVADERYGWYVVVENQGDMLPEAEVGSWVLAVQEPDTAPPGRRYVILGSWQAWPGGILVQPVGHSTAVTHCYLGYRDDAGAEPQLFLDGRRQPVPAESVLVLALVAGMWRELADQRPVMREVRA